MASVLAIGLLGVLSAAQDVGPVLVELDGGVVRSIANGLTGEIYTREPVTSSEAPMVRLCESGKVYDLHHGEDGAAIETTLTREGADAVIRQTARYPEGGVSGVWLPLAPLDAEKVTLLIPGVGGVSLGPDSAVSDVTYHYPGAWGTPALVIQGALGGVLLSADDPGSAFLAMRVTRLRAAWRVAVLTMADPPWAELTECRSARWRLTAYRGPWTVAAALQRERLRAAFGLTPQAEREPAWARDIQCVVRVVGGGPFEEPLRALAREVEPRKTLLYLPEWRTHPYDVMYPDYTPSPRALAFIELAHELGFRVMAHGNLVGISPFHPRVEEFRDAVERDPVTGGLVGWYLDRDVPGQIYCLNPAFSAVRKLLIDAFVESHRQTGFDALHLDYPAIIQSAHGVVEGMNPIQGTVRLLRDLAEAMPDVPLATEGISDFMLDCWWAQLGEPFWNNNEIMGRYHPIRAAVFSEFCGIYGHLGLPDQQTDLQGYLSFIEAHDRTGCVPTFTLNCDHGLDMASPGTRYALRQARFFMDKDPRADYSTTLEPVGAEGDEPALPYFAWRLGDGGALAVVQTALGRKWIVRDQEGPWRELWRVYQGVREISGPLHVPGWLAYSGERTFGLDPRAIYLPDEGAPDPLAFHVSSVSTPVRVALSGSDARRDVVRLEPAEPNALDLTASRPDRAGVIVDGEERPMGHGASFSTESLVVGGVALQGIWAHPPFQFPRMDRGEFSPDFRPAVFGEYRLRLPDAAGLRFAARIGLRDPATAEAPLGDGVTFRVLVDGAEIIARHCERRAWEELTADLSPWRGQEIAIALVTDVGPAGRPDFDWACWGEPRVTTAPRPGSSTVALEQPNQAGTLVVTDETGTRNLEPGAALVDVALPAGFVYAREVTDVHGSVPLSELPMQAYLVSGAASTRGSVFGGGMPTQWRQGDEVLPAVSGHTPAWGQTHLEWLLRLPAEPLRLAFGAAVQPGGEQVGFAVQVNTRTLWNGGFPGAGRMVAGAVDLSPWAGQVVLVSLVTDSLGSNNSDWAVWVAPRLEPAGAGG